jgi:hypothetical protein
LSAASLSYLPPSALHGDILKNKRRKKAIKFKDGLRDLQTAFPRTAAAAASTKRGLR